MPSQEKWQALKQVKSSEQVFPPPEPVTPPSEPVTPPSEPVTPPVGTRCAAAGAGYPAI